MVGSKAGAPLRIELNTGSLDNIEPVFCEEQEFRERPHMIPRYEIRSVIAKGEGGVVHRAWDRETNCEVVLKRAGALMRDDALLAEAAMLRRIRHPNVVSFLDAGRDDDGAFLVMEFVAGRTLEGVVADCPLDSVEFALLATQSLEGVIAAHAQNIMHLDLKPQNLLWGAGEDGRMRVKILDFGVAVCAPSEPGANRGDHCSPVMGSLFYMSPERFDRAQPDARADLYSLGCVFYFALTRLPPFHGETAPQVMVAHICHQFTSLAEMRPDLPAFIPCWVEWLFKPKREDRPVSATLALEVFRSGSVTRCKTP